MNYRRRWLVIPLIVVLALAAGDILGGPQPEPVAGQTSGSGSSAPQGEHTAELEAYSNEPEVVSPEGVVLTDLRVPGSVLRPRGSDVEYLPAPIDIGGGCLYASAGNANRIFNTPVYLPNGSEVQLVRMYYDDASTENANGWFTVYDLYGVIIQEWSVSSVGNSGRGFNDTVFFSHVINYEQYSYALNWQPVDLGSDMQICGFRLYYEPPPFGQNYLPEILYEPE